MGAKGQTRTSAARDAATHAAERLAPLGAVAPRGMFGGYGLFHDGVMFGLVDGKGLVHLRVDGETRSRFEAAGGQPHGKMPYVSVPPAVLADDATFQSWASDALATAHAAKK